MRQIITTRLKAILYPQVAVNGILVHRRVPTNALVGRITVGVIGNNSYQKEVAVEKRC